MKFWKRLYREVLLAVTITILVAVGLMFLLGPYFFQVSPLDIQLHNTYIIIHSWELVLLLSLPIWLLAQLTRGVLYWWQR
ncbi:hypothetical protein [Hymenobacter fodinae]|uniref:hypothetical protein n=1 Tax=Hymenobacter fodinae TaxID=2510796 RepID=UPI00143693A4|nr:hypothetical protein [Hymenobacter fodinae]